MFCTNYTNKVPQICYLETRCWIVDIVTTTNSFDPCPWQPMTHASKVLSGLTNYCLCSVSLCGSYIKKLTVLSWCVAVTPRALPLTPFGCCANSVWWSWHQLYRLGFWNMEKLGNIPNITESDTSESICLPQLYRITMLFPAKACPFCGT